MIAIQFFTRAGEFARTVVSRERLERACADMRSSGAVICKVNPVSISKVG